MDLEQIEAWFDGRRLIGSRIGDDRAELWTAFRLHRDDFNRVLVYNRGLDSYQTGRLLRRLLELETYRTMTLLAFPQARQISRQVTRMEQHLAQTISTINGLNGADEERQVLHRLAQCAADIAQLIAESRYRFDATDAYYALVESRLQELRETELNGLQTMAEFVKRRLTPAFRTVEATQRRMDDLARRIDRASAPLRTRIDMKIEAQNQELLQSMDRRIALQVYLQQTVEGLSIVVISSCLVGLLYQVTGATKLLPVAVDRELLMAGLVPVSVTLVWYLSRRWRRGVNGLQNADGGDG